MLSTRYDLALLLYLAMNPVTHGREKMAHMLWPEINRLQAMNNLRSSLSRLRAAGFGQWLDISRSLLLFRPDDHFLIDTSGDGEIAEGLEISILYDAWLEALRHDYTVIRQPLPESWKPKTRSETSAIADFCRQHLDLLIYRGENLWKFERAYADLVAAFVSLTDPGNKFVVGTGLFNLSILTGYNVSTTIKVLSSTVNSSSDTVYVGSLFAVSAISAMHRFPCDFQAAVGQAQSAINNSNAMLMACYHTIEMIFAMEIRNYPLAIEHGQIALAYGYQARTRYHSRILSQLAMCYFLSGQHRLARTYLLIARETMLDQRSFHMLPQVDKIQELLDHA